MIEADTFDTSKPSFTGKQVIREPLLIKENEEDDI
jgi:hypothetical protein